MLKKKIRMSLTLAAVVLLGALPAHPSFASGSYSTEKSGFSLKFRDRICPYKVFGIFVLPEEKIPLEVMDPDPGSSYVLAGARGGITTVDAAKWVWQAPAQPGIFTIIVKHEESRADMTLNVFVMIPYDGLKGDYLNDYRIGKYPVGDSGKPGVSCEPPWGFVEVTRENEDTRLSPHFRLKQFLCKQNGGYPKYVVLRENLIFKLEYLLEKVNDAGYPCTTFTVMSGYRTPYYNRLIGNGAYSRHLYGEAVDIFVDHQPKDNMMDDLNGDGKLDWKDAKVLCGIIEGLCGTKPYENFIGGLGAYEKTPYHGPFIHVDVRGCKARWGK